MVACRLRIYSFISHSPAASKASATYDHPHPPSPNLRADIPAILQATQWWNPSIAFSITSVTT